MLHVHGGLCKSRQISNEASHHLAIALNHGLTIPALRRTHVDAITIPLNTLQWNFRSLIPKTFQKPQTCMSVWIEQPWWVRRSGVRTECLWKPYYSPRVQQSASFPKCPLVASVGTSYGRWSNHPLLYAWYFRSRLQTFTSGPKRYDMAQQLIMSLVTEKFKSLFGDSRDEAPTQIRIFKLRTATCTRGNNFTCSSATRASFFS